MKSSFSRRHFLKTSVITSVGVGLAGLRSAHIWATETTAQSALNAEKLGWKLGMQAWTFHQSTVFDAIDKTALLGLRYIEVYPGQRLNDDPSNGFFGETMSPNRRKLFQKKLADAWLTVVNYGVCTLPKNIKQSRKVFDFAKELNIETLVSEPNEDAFENLDKLCGEYKINVAIHNHPEPSHYWNPDLVLKVCQGLSPRIGACADTGHWARSGLNPIDCLKKLKGHIICLHFKDVDKMGPDAKDVPWGTGICDVKGMLLEIYRQKIKPVFSIEYDYSGKDLMPQLEQSIAYFDRCTTELAALDINWPAPQKRAFEHR